MTKLYRTLLNRVGRFWASVISGLLLIIILILLAGQLFFFWLTTDRGSAWLGARLSDISRMTPYTVQFDEFKLQGLFGIKATRLTVADGKGVFISAQNIGLDIDVLPLAMRQAAANFDAGEIILIRMPSQTETAQTETEQETGPFRMPARPDIYFNSLRLRMAIDNFVLAKDAPGGPRSIAIASEQTVDLEAETLISRGQVVLEDPDDILPQEIKHTIYAPWETREFTLDTLRLRRDGLYNLSGKGYWQGGEEKFDLTLNATAEKDIHPRLDRKITAAMQLGGTFDDYNGNIDIGTALVERPLSVSAQLNGNRDMVTMKPVKGQGYGFALDGGMRYGLNNETGLNGKITANFDHFGLVQALTNGVDLAGRGNIALTMKNSRPSFDADLRGLAYQGRAIQQVTATLDPVSDGRYDMRLRATGPAENAFTLSSDVTLDPPQKTVNIKQTVLNGPFGQLRLTGRAAPQDMDMKLTAQNIIPADLPYGLGPDIPLRIPQAELVLQGPANAPIIKAEASIHADNAQIRGADFKLAGQYQNGRTNLNVTGTGEGVESLAAQLSMPLQISLYPFAFNLPQTTPIGGALAAAFDLKPVLAPFLTENQSAAGRFMADIDIGGILNDPDVTGYARIDNARFFDNSAGIFLKDIMGDIGLAGTRINVNTLTAKDREGGSLAASGTVDMSGGMPPNVNIDVTADDMHLLRGSEHRVRVGADLSIGSQGDEYMITGNVVPNEVLITLPERFNASVPELNIVEENVDRSTPFLNQVKLDIDVRADNRVFIRGWGLDVEVGGRLDITETAADPDVDGTLRVIRGRYEEFGKRFDITRADLRFQGNVPPSPYLDIVAETKAEEITARIRITGPAIEPELGFGSTPDLPEDEILSRILFGQDASQISPFQAIQLSNTIRRFSGHGGGLDPIGELRNLTGLDDLRVEGGSGDDVTVGAGKYLTDKVYFEVETGNREEAGAAKVEIEITPSITVESKAGSNGNSGAGVFWEWDY